jgi:hypothetical protein
MQEEIFGPVVGFVKVKDFPTSYSLTALIQCSRLFVITAPVRPYSVSLATSIASRRR